MKKLLILGGIQTEINIVRQAKKMGVYTIVADNNPGSPAKKHSDESVLMDVTNVDSVVDFCKRNKIDGIISGYVDILLEPWRESCKELGLPCYLTSKMIKMSTDKIFFKENCTKYGIPVPTTYYCGGSLNETVLKSINYPVFVKPLDASGSRGCGVCNNEEELISQFNSAICFSKTRNVVIEDYIEGVEFLLDYIGVDGDFTLLEMFDRRMSNDRGSARNYSNVSIAPSFGIDRFCSELDSKIKTMFRDMGFKDGLIFLQGHVCKDKIVLYEMGCRLGGSFIDLEQNVLGFNSVELLINHALYGSMTNQTIDIPEKCASFKKICCVNNFLLKCEGDTVKRIVGLEKLSKDRNYISHFLLKDVGFKCMRDTIVDKPILSIFFSGNDIGSIRNSISYFNSVFDVFGENGDSLLMEKFDPKDLK